MKKITTYILLAFFSIVFTGCAETTYSFSEMVLSESQTSSPAISQTSTRGMSSRASTDGTFVSYHSPDNPANNLFFIEAWKISYPEPEPTPDPQIKQNSEIDLSMPMLALTFDDGPSGYTAQILDILEHYGARATFCIIGDLAERGSGLISNAFEAGCEIIGHSWSHGNMRSLTAQDIKREILDTHAAIESITGDAPQMYRVPYGAFNDRVKQVSEELGFSIISWSVDPRDWEAKDADQIYDSILDSVFDGAIVICHDTYESTAEAMERVIPDLITHGYQLVTVSELFTYKGIPLEPGKVYRHGSATVSDGSL